MKTSLLLLALVVLAACVTAKPTATDSQGRVFVLVREETAFTDGIVNAALWQLRGETGDAFPYYLRLLTPEGQPPMFTRAL